MDKLLTEMTENMTKEEKTVFDEKCQECIPDAITGAKQIFLDVFGIDIDGAVPGEDGELPPPDLSKLDETKLRKQLEALETKLVAEMVSHGQSTTAPVTK